MDTETTDAVRTVKLTKLQLKRLVDVVTRDGSAFTCPKTNSALVVAGVLEPFIRHGARRVRLTPLGTRVLAGLPGPEFDRFRDVLAKLELTP